MTGLLTWNDSGILVLFNVGLLGAVPQGVGVVLLHRIVELDLKMAKFSIRAGQSCTGQISRSVQQSCFPGND